MALVSDGYELSISLLDTQGDTSTLRYRLRATTAADAATDAGTIITALSAITLSDVISYRLTEVFLEDNFTTFPVGADNDQRVALTVQLAGLGQKKASLEVPAPNPAIFVATSGPGANEADTTDVDLLAYIALFTATGEATISDGEDVLTLLSGKRTARRLRR